LRPIKNKLKKNWHSQTGLYLVSSWGNILMQSLLRHKHKLKWYTKILHTSIIIINDLKGPDTIVAMRWLMIADKSCSFMLSLIAISGTIKFISILTILSNVKIFVLVFVLLCFLFIIYCFYLYLHSFKENAIKTYKEIKH
jgi:hypothetical protein